MVATSKAVKKIAELLAALSGVISANGCVSIPVFTADGVKPIFIQRGEGYTDSTSVKVTFPIVFSNGILCVGSEITTGDGRFSTVGEISQTGFNAYGRDGGTVLNNFMWISVGF